MNTMSGAGTVLPKDRKHRIEQSMQSVVSKLTVEELREALVEVGRRDPRLMVMAIKTCRNKDKVELTPLNNQTPLSSLPTAPSSANLETLPIERRRRAPRSKSFAQKETSNSTITTTTTKADLNLPIDNNTNVTLLTTLSSGQLNIEPPASFFVTTPPLKFKAHSRVVFSTGPLTPVARTTENYEVHVNGPLETTKGKVYQILPDGGLQVGFWARHPGNYNVQVFHCHTDKYDPVLPKPWVCVVTDDGMGSVNRQDTTTTNKVLSSVNTNVRSHRHQLSDVTKRRVSKKSSGRHDSGRKSNT